MTTSQLMVGFDLGRMDMVMMIKSRSCSLYVDKRKIHLVDMVVGVHFQMDTYGHEGRAHHELMWKLGWKDNRYPDYMVQLA